jgi:FkbM family methyltransferase
VEAAVDYPGGRVRLNVDSEMDVYRSRGCRKEPETVAWIESHMKPGEVFYDIGANVGVYSLVAAERFNGAVAVHAFEPGFANYAQLCRNIILNGRGDCVFPYPVCVTEDNRMCVFNYHGLEAGAALHTVGAGNLTDAFGKPFRAPFVQSVLGLSLDYVVFHLKRPAPDHIKIDVDGGETAILRGGEQTLKTVRTLMVETLPEHAADVRACLESRGFAARDHAPRGPGRNRGTIENVLYVRR